MISNEQLKMEGKRAGNAYSESNTSISFNCDKSRLPSLDNVHLPENLEQLSATHNHIRELSCVVTLRNLMVLNLCNNNISELSGIRHLVRLKWLNLSSNKLTSMENLSNNTNLQHIDLSDNLIARLGDIRGLTKLKVLLLHGNKLESLAMAKTMLPRSLNTLSLALNVISDLNEISNLSHLVRLEQFSILGNPCVQTNLQFDYRPFIINWCIKVRILDGTEVSHQEGGMFVSLKAEWLFSQGKGRRFTVGQHVQLVEYLSTVCPSDINAEVKHSEQVRLSRVQQKQQKNSNEFVMLENQLKNNNEPVLSAPIQRIEDLETPGDSSPVMLESESRYLPVLADTIPDLDLQIGMTSTVNIGQSQTTSKPTFNNAESFSSQPRCMKPATDRARERPVVRRLAANFSKSVSNATDNTRTSSGNKPIVSKHEPEGSNVLLSASKSTSSELVKIPLVHNGVRSNDTIQAAPVMTHLKSQPRIDKTPQGKLENRRLLKGVMMKSPGGRRDESGVLLATSSLHYSPEKYRNTMRQIFGNDNGIEEDIKSREQSSKSQQHLASNNVDSQERHRAAVAIQALWRGFTARRKDSEILAFRQELRTRRLEDHIRFLRLELDRHNQQSEQERRLRVLHVEALKLLCSVLKSLHDWKDDMISTSNNGSVLSANLDSSKTKTQLESTRHLIGFLEKFCEPFAEPSQSTPSSQLLQSANIFHFGSSPSSGELGLDSICQNLQKQLTELKEVVTSGIIVCGNSLSASYAFANSQQLPVPHDVSVQKLGSNKVMMNWKHSLQVKDGYSLGGHLLGFRVFIDDRPVAMVGCNYNSAVISDLLPNHNYSFSVQAVFTHCESAKTEPVKLFTQEPADGCHVHLQGDSTLNDSCDLSDGVSKYYEGGTGIEKTSNNTSPLQRSPVGTFRNDESAEVTNKDHEKHTSTEEEAKFVPKPPLDVSVARIGGLRRQGSARRRHCSASSGTVVSPAEDLDAPICSSPNGLRETQVPVSDCNALSTGSSNMNSRVVQIAEYLTEGQFFLPTARRLETAGDEARSRSKAVRSKVERRSSSLGANLRQLVDRNVDQPQRRPVSVQKSLDLTSSPENKFGRTIQHKRSRSDLPNKDIDKSQMDRPEPTPTSSPRLWRSSSFSISHGSTETSPLRQAVSLEILKAFNERRNNTEEDSSNRDASSAEAANDSQDAMLGKQHKPLQPASKSMNLLTNSQKLISPTNTKS